MKEIRPEDLSINPRVVGGNDTSAKQNPMGNDTSLNCYTGAPCDTVDNCSTKVPSCHTAICGASADCVDTKYCQTSACGDTRTKAEICCPMPTGSPCVVYTRECRETELCAVSKELCAISKDISCRYTDLCSTDEDCNLTLTCVVSDDCEETQVCMRPTILGC